MIKAFRSMLARERFGRYDEHGEPNKIITLSEYQFGNTDKSSGIVKGFTLNSYVYAIIDMIATSARNIPVEVVMRNSQNEYEIVKEGEFYDLVHRPNEMENWGSMLYQAIVFQLANGNTFEHPVIPTGFSAPTKRYNLFPQYVKIKADEVFYGYKPTEYKYHFGKTIYNYTPEEILHIKRFNPILDMDEPLYGLSPLRAGYRTLVSSNEILTAEASIIKNRGVSGLLTSRANRPLNKEEKDMADQALKKQIGGGHKMGALSVTSGNFDLISLGMSPTDLKLLDAGQLRLRDLCSIYHVSSRLFNDEKGTTFNNVKEDDKKYYTNAVLPPLEIYIENFNEFYTPLFEKATGKTFKLRAVTDHIPALQENDLAMYRKGSIKLEGIQSVIEGIANGTWTAESGRAQLMSSFDISEEEANELINETTIRSQAENE